MITPVPWDAISEKPELAMQHVTCVNQQNELQHYHYNIIRCHVMEPLPLCKRDVRSAPGKLQAELQWALSSVDIGNDSRKRDDSCTHVAMRLMAYHYARQKTHFVPEKSAFHAFKHTIRAQKRTIFRAMYPSRKSVKDATTNIPDAHAAAAGSEDVKSHMTGGMAKRRPMVSIVGSVHTDMRRFLGLRPLFSGAAGLLAYATVPRLVTWCSMCLCFAATRSSRGPRVNGLPLQALQAPPSLPAPAVTSKWPEGVPG
jgi:hypothetical protein